MSANVQLCLRERPAGEVTPGHFQVRRAPIPEPGPGEVLVRNLYLLVPPSMRLWMNDRPSYVPAQPLGEVMMGITLGRVAASDDPALPVGALVNGMGGCQDWYVARREALMPVFPHPEVPLAAYRSVLDVQGLTAWSGLVEVARPQAGETLVVTAAAGSVGSLVCQIGKRLGLRVVGIAGGADKCDWLVRECGIDAAIDYRAEDVAARLDATCPEGVDILFENVGGPVMDRVLERIRERARIVLCGMVATYNGAAGTQRSEALMELVNKSARMEGFLVRDYFDRYAEVIGRLESWVLDGSLKYRIDVLDGLDSLVEALHRVATGRNLGIQLVRLAAEEAQ